MNEYNKEYSNEDKIVYYEELKDYYIGILNKNQYDNKLEMLILKEIERITRRLMRLQGSDILDEKPK
jgi:hypothetical protein